MTDLLLLAQEGIEGVSPDHLAAKLAVPIGILIFAGSVYALLWAIYGARKAAAVYLTAFFGFMMILGLFWWFGAPGTPRATGLQQFPWQLTEDGRSDLSRYLPRWTAFEPGSELASFFPETEDGLEQFQTPAEYVGAPDADDETLTDSPIYRFVFGGLDTASRLMAAQFMPVDENGALRIGGQRRAAWNEAAGDPEGEETRADPFFTSRPSDLDGDEEGDVFIMHSPTNGIEIAAAELEAVATFEQFTEEGRETREVVVERSLWFAYNDPGAAWFPSAVTTILSALLFAASLFWLDLIEQREKRRAAAATTIAAPAGEARETVSTNA